MKLKERRKKQVTLLVNAVAKQYTTRIVLDVLEDYPSLERKLYRWILFSKIKILKIEKISIGYDYLYRKPVIKRKGDQVWIIFNK